MTHFRVEVVWRLAHTLVGGACKRPSSQGDLVTVDIASICIGIPDRVDAFTGAHRVWHKTSRIRNPRAEVDTLAAQHSSNCDFEKERRQSSGLLYAVANHNGPGAARRHVELVLFCSRGDQIGLAFVASQVSRRIDRDRVGWSAVV